MHYFPKLFLNRISIYARPRRNLSSSSYLNLLSHSHSNENVNIRTSFSNFCSSFAVDLSPRSAHLSLLETNFFPRALSSTSDRKTALCLTDNNQSTEPLCDALSNNSWSYDTLDEQHSDSNRQKRYTNEQLEERNRYESEITFGLQKCETLFTLPHQIYNMERLDPYNDAYINHLGKDQDPDPEPEADNNEPHAVFAMLHTLDNDIDSLQQRNNELQTVFNLEKVSKSNVLNQLNECISVLEKRVIPKKDNKLKEDGTYRSIKRMFFDEASCKWEYTFK